ncbi:hypothetical protein Air01nite_34980 [Asanoa iriomotensis]|uniref:ABC transporter substrate-binding protein n=1 Tax=Asanoa iriomotensis TaxID=234613 RepID=A0ABQ4C3Q7_9ACTN|nr:hypothetical protein Air01nite_34980 [Asanoa iriomotensis]
MATVACLALSACGGSPTATAESSAGGGDDCFAKTAKELDDIYGQLEGLSMDQRTAKLKELAKDKGPVTITASTNPDDAKITYPAFTKATGVEVELQSADADSGRARLVEEIKACHAGTDVFIADATEVAPMEREGWLLPLNSPNLDAIPDSAKLSKYFASDTVNVFVAAWNTKQVKGGDVPTTWEEVLAHPKAVAVDVGDYVWFATLVKDYFVKEKGMTEEQAIDLFRNAASKMIPTDGHTLMVQLLAAGEFDIIADGYQHSVQSNVNKGAPIAWKDPKPVEPIVVRPGGDAIPITADNLPGALLYIDWTLSMEHAKLSVSMNRTTVLPIEGGLDPNIKAIPVSTDLINDPDAVKKWEDLWESVIRQTGKKPLSK